MTVLTRDRKFVLHREGIYFSTYTDRAQELRARAMDLMAQRTDLTAGRAWAATEALARAEGIENAISVLDVFEELDLPTAQSRAISYLGRPLEDKSSGRGNEIVRAAAEEGGRALSDIFRESLARLEILGE